MNPENYLYLSAMLFTIGATGVMLRRNALVMFMCVELMLNAVNLAFVTFARMHGHLDGQMIAFFTMVVAACEVVVGLAIIYPQTRHQGVIIGFTMALLWMAWDGLRSGSRSGPAGRQAPLPSRRKPSTTAISRSRCRR